MQSVGKTGDSGEKIDLNIERENHSTWLGRKSFRIVLVSTFTALAIVLGYLLAYLPNIELFTLTIFLSGFILGKRDGMIVGFFSSFIFCFFNPFGVSPLPLLAFQLFYYSMTGLLGGFSSKFLSKKDYFKPDEDLYTLHVLVIFGIIGGFMTFSYDIFSTALGVILVSPTIEYFLITYSVGIIFTTVHLIGNILGFIFILPALIQLIRKLIY
ncbi:hypothetical protein LCGC14_1270090 [marine sediment metagenome]|uniref:ECF transporter S component n=1 Tax=marine sediment metagenome TaxID=412755 RepID=A0A0F9NF53_9ZZZZ|nr:hypothetical protein [archaeon]HEC37215.1 hypothetical protein [bacterium]